MSAPDRPHPLARSNSARWADRLIGALWKHDITPKPPLEPDYLWDIGATGFEPEDEISLRTADEVSDFRIRLDRLCRSIRDEAQLNSLGHTMAYGQITSAIRKRHELGRLWREQPQLAQKKIAAPIIVVGQMRAGTTRMHRLLAADPRHTGTRFCNSHDPVPRAPDYRPFKAAAGLAIARQINPWLDSLHPFGATRVDEEIGWLAQAFSPCSFEAQWQISSFVSWSETRNPETVYAEFARVLRTDAATMGDADSPRVLKCPQFAEDLPAMLKHFPDARVVVARRKHSEVLESSVSLVASQMAFQSDKVDLEQIRSEWQRKLEMRDERIDEALADFAGPVAKVDFTALGQDWSAEIARTYACLGIHLTPCALDAIAGEHRRAAADKHDLHAAQLTAFGAS